MNPQDDKKPCGEAVRFFAEHKCETPTQLAKDEFNARVMRSDFKHGPFRETFGDGHGEPYSPRRQAFGIDKSGNGFYAQIS